jgi:hypothetical protein
MECINIILTTAQLNNPTFVLKQLASLTLLSMSIYYLHAEIRSPYSRSIRQKRKQRKYQVQGHEVDNRRQSLNVAQRVVNMGKIDSEPTMPRSGCLRRL